MAFKMNVAYLASYQSQWDRLQYKHLGDSGFDLRACIEEDIILEPGEFRLIPAGIKIELVPEENDPFNYEVQIRARSGLAAKNGIGVINAPGTVDFYYRGEIKVPLVNFSKQAFTIHPGDRIAQAVIAPVITAQIISVDKINEETTRSSGGFGSTGTK